MGRIWLAVLVTWWIGAAAHAATMTTSISNPSFGSSHVGTAGTTTQTITINNALATSTLTFSVSSDSSDFTVIPASGMVAAGGSTTVTITFTPSQRGTRNATITVSGNDAANPSDAYSVSGTGTSGNLVVTWTGSPGALDFGTAAIAGGTTTRTITISNPAPANEPLMFSLDVTAGGSDFAETDPTTTTLAVGASIPVTVTFNPTTSGTRTGVATISANDAFNAADAVNLTGAGQGAVFTPSTTSIDFGTIPVGSFAEQPLTITNTGNQTGSVTAIMSASSVFTFTVVGTPPFMLSPMQSMQVTIRFTPVDGSVVMSNLIYMTDGTPASQSIALTGDGLSRTISITATNEPDLMIDLGDVRVATMATRHVTVTNTGEGAVTLMNVSSNSAPCAVQLVSPTALPVTLTSTQTATFDINVTPTAVGLGACTITVTTNIPTTDTIEIAYRGVAPEVAVTVPTMGAIDFGVVDVDAATEVRTVVLTNTGTAPLAIGPCAIAGTTRFVVITSCTGLTIAPAATATLMIGYDPTVETIEDGELTIGVDALSTSQVKVTLHGIGADQHIDLSTLAVAFPDTDVGASDPPIQYIDVRNPLNMATSSGRLLAISTVTTDKEVFTLANQGPFTVEPGGMIRLAITFRPIAGTTYDGTLVINNDTTGMPMATIPLHGRGIAATETAGCCQGGPATNAPLALCVLLVLRRRRRYF